MKYAWDKNIIAGLYGNALEWYDFLLYASFAPLFATLYFPSDVYFISLMSTFGVFAVGFLMRPIGGILFGHYGDKKGRRKALILSLILMTITTLSIALLPSHSHIGMAAPILFTGLRLLQGLAVGGELPGSATFVIESTFSHRKGFAGSLVLSTAFLGIFFGSLIAALVTNIFPNEQLAWSWRLAYLLGGVLGIIGIYLRIKSVESTEFLKIEKSVYTPFMLILSQYKTQLMIAVLITSIVAIGNYILIAYFNVFLIKHQGFSLPEVIKINLIALFFLTILIPIMGFLSDYIGYKRLFIIGLCGLLIFIFPVFLLLTKQDYYSALYGELLLSIILSPINATVAILITEMFPANIRASGISIGYNIGQAIFGGTVPLVALSLIELTGNTLMPAWYVFLWNVIVLLIISLKKI